EGGIARRRVGHRAIRWSEIVRECGAAGFVAERKRQADHLAGINLWIQTVAYGIRNLGGQEIDREIYNFSRSAGHAIHSGFDSSCRDDRVRLGGGEVAAIDARQAQG